MTPPHAPPPCAGLTGCCPSRFLISFGIGQARRPLVRPGGWAFQYANPHYPDLDDTAVVVMAMDRARRIGPETAMTRLSRVALNG